MTVSNSAQIDTEETRLRRESNAAWDNWLEIISVVLLAFASLAAAWSGYQATRWSGVQSSAYSRAIATRIESSEASTNASVYEIGDWTNFNAFANAYATGNQQLMRFYQNRFSPQLKVAADAWLATNPLQNPNAPASPFVMAQYKLPEMERSQQLEQQATALFAKGEQANEHADDYVQSTVILALVLFFSGIASKINLRHGRTTIVAVGMLLLLFSCYQLLTFPID